METASPKRWQYSYHLYGASALEKDPQQPQRTLKRETLYFCLCHNMVSINYILETVTGLSAASRHAHKTVVVKSVAAVVMFSWRVLRLNQGFLPELIKPTLLLYKFLILQIY